MSGMADAEQTAVGFRVKSGWATAILLGWPVQSPVVLESAAVALSDPAVPASRQPYHARMGVLEEDIVRIEQRTSVVKRVALRSVAELLGRYRASGHLVRAAGLVVGSLTDPGSIRNTHMRAHALEGQLFRKVLQEALEPSGLKYLTVRESDVYAQAAALLSLSAGDVQRAVAAMGRSLAGPWRVEQKSAAAGAWLALVSPLVHAE